MPQIHRGQNIKAGLQCSITTSEKVLCIAGLPFSSQHYCNENLPLRSPIDGADPCTWGPPFWSLRYQEGCCNGSLRLQTLPFCIDDLPSCSPQHCVAATERSSFRGWTRFKLYSIYKPRAVSLLFTIDRTPRCIFFDSTHGASLIACQTWAC